MKDKTNIIAAILIGLTVGLAFTLMSIKSRKNNSFTDLGNLQRQSLKKYSYEHQETPMSPK